MATNFSQELLAAARGYLDTEAVRHQRFAGNCIESPSEQCLSNGLGPDSFDCSGLVLRSMADVAGLQVGELAPGIRHVRDMWHGASNGNQVLRHADLGIGNLLITSRQYNLGGKTVEIPGHIGIVTVLDEIPTFIHANPHAGKVEERPLKTLDSKTMLGSIAVTLE